ncbi:MAG: tripartite tricarboxylate transporter substrate binding protein [Rhodospirillaceae bacterium]
MSRHWNIYLVAAALAVCSASARTADFPEKPVRMVVPLAPGGGSDIVGRIVALALTDHWHKSVVVDNRPGAGSVVGTSIVAKAPADGYTVLVSSSSFAISPALYPHLSYDPRRDFAPVMLLASQPSLLVIHASVPARTLKELIALAKAKPGQLAYGSAGIGSATHLGTELFLHTAGISAQHVPYKSAGQATTAVLSGEAQLLITNTASVLPHLQSGKIRALGTTATERSPLAPDVPTINESGLPGFEYATWYGAFVPGGTAALRVAAIHRAMHAVLGQSATRQQLTAQGLQTHASSPDEFKRYLDAELKRWQSVIGAARIAASG